MLAFVFPFPFLTISVNLTNNPCRYLPCFQHILSSLRTAQLATAALPALTSTTQKPRYKEESRE